MLVAWWFLHYCTLLRFAVMALSNQPPKTNRSMPDIATDATSMTGTLAIAHWHALESARRINSAERDRKMTKYARIRGGTQYH